MDKISPIIITSNKAQKDLDNIKFQHRELLRSMAEQNMRVTNLNMQKEQENQIKADKDNQIAKDKSDADFKTKELEIKRMALNG